MEVAYSSSFLEQIGLPHDRIILPEFIKDICRALARMEMDVPVLIFGETGTGKEFVARYLHELRCEASQTQIKFVTINCALLDSGVADSVIFGHKKGAFTGASETRIGAVEEADGGILFLDEIHCLSISSQRKLLRVLNDGSFTRVGDVVERKSRFTLISATNHNLSDLAEKGQFVFDLLMRIAGLDVTIPPLRERKEEMELLIAQRLLEKKADIRPEDFQAIVAKCRFLKWSGNVRQLFKRLDAAMVFARIHGKPLSSDFISEGLSIAPSASFTRQEALAVEPQPSPSGQCPVERAKRLLESLRSGPGDLEYIVEQIEASLIEFVLDQTKSIHEALAYLSITRGQMDFKRRKYGLMQRRDASLLLKNIQIS